ncbi:hypothetical protein HDV04_005676 [Boothiomyces sp. JEL0838]|nr:hypothetical protein HDV04_005676 [Boothiomyces sp. JEL0838]
MTFAVRADNFSNIDSEALIELIRLVSMTVKPSIHDRKPQTKLDNSRAKGTEPCYFINAIETFPTQSQAFERQEQIPKSRIFSFEYDKERPGKRKFVVSRTRDFWDTYIHLENKHHYELIKEGDPCNLYFDLEYEYEYNMVEPDLEATAVSPSLLSKKECSESYSSVECQKHTLSKVPLELDIQKFIDILALELKSIGVDDFISVDLDSSSSKKYSHHLIVRMKNKKFKNNLQCGIFVNNFYKKLLDNNQFIIRTKDDRKVFIDDGVYTKNRNFRLYLSSKIGKHAILKMKNAKATFKLFLDTLVVDDEPIAELMDYGNNITKTPISKPSTINQYNGLAKSVSSNYPEIEYAIMSHINYYSTNTAYIKSVINLDQKLIIVIGGSRYCHRIQREHRSNSVYYIADLVSSTFHQRCYDPDCKNYRSPEVNYDLDDYFCISDAQLLSAVESVDSYFEMDDDVFLNLNY